MLKRRPTKIYMLEIFDDNGKSSEDMLISRNYYTRKADAEKHFRKVVKEHPLLLLSGNINCYYPNSEGYIYGYIYLSRKFSVDILRLEIEEAVNA